MKLFVFRQFNRIPSLLELLICIAFEQDESLSDCGLSFKTTVRKYVKQTFSYEMLKKRFPIILWLPSYTWKTFAHDAIAGLTVGFTAIPQGIAYAVVAGLEPQYGLYSGFMGAFVYIFLGSCKDVTIGPTAILSMMAQQAVVNNGADFAVLLTFLTGCVILLLGLLHLGFLVDFISMPVTSGFTSAAAITIASSQLKGLLGLGGRTNDFLDSWVNTVEKIQETELWDVVLGVSTIIILVALRTLKTLDGKVDKSQSSSARKLISQVIWFLSMASNAIVAIMGTGLAYALYKDGKAPFKITGDIAQGLPPFEAPPFSSTFNNQTFTFSDMANELGSTVITLPLIAILESVAIAKAFAKGKALDATQEMIALGCCNIFGSFCRSMPVTGSFTRTAVNNASGVKTPLGGLITGGVVLLALGLLTSTFYFIPKATLSGIIIAAMFFMVEFSVVPLLWRTKRLDLIPLLCTFFCCLFISLEYGMIIGIGVNVLFLLYDSARPKVAIQQLQIQGQEMLVVSPQQSIGYPAAEYMRSEVMNLISLITPSVIVLDGSQVNHIDATVAKVLKLLVKDLEDVGCSSVFWKWNSECRRSILGIDQNGAHLFRYTECLEQLLYDQQDQETTLSCTTLVES